MKKFQKYAFLPLIVGLVAAVIALILRITSGQFTIAVRISIILAAIGLVLSVVFDPGSILHFLPGPAGKAWRECTRPDPGCYRDTCHREFIHL